MGPIPFAFSVHHFISSVGADAGFASIIGLAILVLLYFAQARETASLRDHAYESAQRVQELEGRLAALGRSQPAVAPPPRAAVAATPGATALSAARQPPAPSPAPSRPLQNPVAIATAPSASAGPGGATATAPAPPANVGAPALAAATRLIPGPGGAATAEPAAEPAAEGAEPAAEGPEPAREQAIPPQERPIGAKPVAAPAPATAAGAANGGPREHVAAPVAARQAPVREPQRAPTRSGGASPAGRRPVPPRAGLLQEQAPSRARRLLPLLIVALALVAVVIVLLVLTSAGTSHRTAGSTSAASNAPAPRHRGSTGAIKPASVTAAVLNGTATPLLAHRVAVKLQGAGYRQGTIATATDQTRKATVVAYLPSHKRDALAVASTLKLGSASVQPIDASTQAVACPPPSSCTATVVVTVGSDLASTP